MRAATAKLCQRLFASVDASSTLPLRIPVAVTAQDSYSVMISEAYLGAVKRPQRGTSPSRRCM